MSGAGVFYWQPRQHPPPDIGRHGVLERLVWEIAQQRLARPQVVQQRTALSAGFEMRNGAREPVGRQVASGI
jgi:hypothetical protein